MTKIGESRVTPKVLNEAYVNALSTTDGVTPQGVAQELGSTQPERITESMLENPRIVEANLSQFRKILDSDLEPYQVIVDIMRNATTPRNVIELIEIKDENGYTKDVRSLTKTVFVPDFSLRSRMALELMRLIGKDPRLQVKIDLNTVPGQVTMFIGNAYTEMFKLGNDAEKLEAYAELKRLERSGRYSLDAPMVSSRIANLDTNE